MKFFYRLQVFIEKYDHCILAAVYCLVFAIAFSGIYHSIGEVASLAAIVAALIAFAVLGISALVLMFIDWFCQYLCKKQNERAAKKAARTKKVTVQKPRKILNVYKNVDELSDEEIRQRFKRYKDNHKK